MKWLNYFGAKCLILAQNIFMIRLVCAYSDSSDKTADVASCLNFSCLHVQYVSVFRELARTCKCIFLDTYQLNFQNVFSDIDQERSIK